MCTLSVRLWFETFPTNVESSLASFAIFCIGATILIIRIANGFTVGHVLLATFWELKRLGFGLTLAFALWISFLIFWGIIWSRTNRNPWQWQHLVLNLWIVEQLQQLLLHWPRSICVFYDPASGGFAQPLSQHLVCFTDLLHGHRTTMVRRWSLKDFKKLLVPPLHMRISTQVCKVKSTGSSAEGLANFDFTC